MSQSQTTIASDPARRAEIMSALKSLVYDLTGIAPENVDVHANFLEVGIDSLTLIQATQLVKEQYDVRLSVVQLLEQLTNIDALASYIDRELPPDVRAELPPPPPVAAPDPTPYAQPAPQRESAAAPAQSVEPPPAHTVVPVAAPAPQPLPPPPYVPPPPPYVPPPAAAQAATEFTTASPPATYGGEPGTISVLDQLMSQQLHVMTQQLEMLRAAYQEPAAARPQTAGHELAPHAGPAERAAEVSVAAPSNGSAPSPAAVSSAAAPPAVAPASVAPATAAAQAPPRPASYAQNQPTYVPYQPIEPGAKGGLTEIQRRHLDDLIARRNARTRESKRLTQEYRPHLADSRTSFGFRLLWKELVYPLISERASGSRVWDVDGNEYVDVSMGFGVHLFGHSPDFVDAALDNQIERKAVQLGPQVFLAGKVARLISELTGLERVNICNSGTEAVMAAMRIARTVTRRSRIAIFAGAYHGWSDLTLAKVSPTGGERRSVPVGPGISPKAVEDVVVLDWDSPDSIEYLNAHAHELAAVMVEPVQSRRPDIQPGEFLRQLRALTAKAGTPLIFDEMITGFRIHTGGAQAWFGVQADIATYGKVIGGGLPIGVIAGKAAYMDAFDGGMWDYGDDSYPQAEKTIFAGAFFKHPLTMSAAHAVLERLRDDPSILPDLNARTARLVATLNRIFEEAELPATVVNFASLFRFMISPELKFVDLFFYHMLEHGVYIWEGRNCFLSTAHTEEDLDKVARAVAGSIEQMRAGGFWPEPPGRARAGGPPSAQTAAGGETAAPAAGPGANNGGPRSAAAPSSPASLTQSSPASSPPAMVTPLSPAAAEPSAPASFLDARVGTGEALVPHVAPQFSLSYFGNYESEYSGDKYELLFAGAKYADEHGFEAVWVPERHFHSFGGFSPNPSVVAAALARETRRLRINAGSVVLPLHNPIRVAEEWSVVDNLSNGRVGISFASGWQPNDFVFAPEAYADRHGHMYRGIEVVQRLWGGEAVPARSGDGKEISVRLAPMPMQPRLPVWLTGVSRATFIKAGELGTRFLTNLQDQSIEELAEKIALYHAALAGHGHDPAAAHVTVLLHTFVAGDLGEAREEARAPLYRYMRSSLGLMGNLVRGSKLKPLDLGRMSDEDLEYILSSGYKRYSESASLIGTPESCAAVIDKLVGIGVNEISCMVDFGVETQAVLGSLEHLNALREKYQSRAPRGDDETLPPIISAAPRPDDPRAAPGVAHAEVVSAADGAGEGEAARLLPLTDAQRQLWITTQIGQDASRAYNESATFRLRGPFDPEAMRRALGQMIGRHDLLRATFSPDGQYQRISPSVSVDVPLVDFSRAAEESREDEAAAWIAREVGEPFDLERGPLVRFRIVRMSEDLHLLVTCNHHLVADGQSWNLMLTELKELYAAAREGREAQLPTPRAFGEYVERQQQIQQHKDGDAAEDYWLGLFADSVPVLELPTDRPRPPVQTYNGKRIFIPTGPALFAEVKRLCSAQGSTVYMTLLAAYAALLHRLSRQEEIIVGVPAAGQLAVGRKEIVGYCVNLLPLRSNAGGDPTFADYLAAVKRRLLESVEHQHYSFGSLLKRLDIPWDASRSPLFTTIFNIDRDEPAARFYDLEIQAVPNQTNWARYDLRMNVIESGDDELVLDCTFNTDLFDESTIRRWMGHFQTLLRAVAADAAQPLWRLPLMADDERSRLLAGHEWSRDGLPSATLHELFEARAAAAPRAPALDFNSERLDYGELNRRADALARRLRSLGVGPEVFVGLCAERSVEAVIGMLGVLKAGGAYVHLDPTHPPERLRFMLKDTGARVLLTQRRWLGQLPPFDGEVLELETACLPAARDGEQAVAGGRAPRPLPDHAAYVYYTSGSTGVPKGVVTTHGAAVNFLNYVVREYGLSSGDVVLQIAALSFDASVRDIFGPLAAGALVILPDETDAKDPAALLASVARHRVTCLLSLVPARLGGLLDAAGARGGRDFASLRLMLFSGEHLPLADCRRAWEVFGDSLSIVNQYGPTECTMISTFHRVGKTEGASGNAPAGAPIDNVQLYVLDERLEPSPPGVPGELHIGGAGLARGYLNRPGLTAEKFVAHPHAEGPGARLYRTGDLARLLPGGGLEILGRLDQQVKIRGLRIEPAEIEAVLGTHAEVREAVVVAREDAPGDRRLVAYVVARAADAPPAASDLRAHLRESLPEYMEPSAFVFLTELPLTRSGKVDRQALPAPDAARTQDGDESAAPQTEVEKLLAEFWCDVLMVERVGLRDDFFELGGNSLLATQLVARLRAALQVELPLRRLFERPTLAELAAEVEEMTRAGGGSLQAPPIEPVSRDGELPLSFAQQRLWFIHQLEPNSRAYNIRGGIRLEGELNVGALEQSFNEIVRRHEVLRTSFSTVDGRPMQVIAPSLTLQLPVIDLTGMPEEEREPRAKEMAIQEAERLFDLAQCPLMRLTLLRLNERDHVLAYSMHHIISDGWSMGILINEMSVLYEAFSNGAPSPLPELSIQYADFAHWQQQWLQGEVLESHLSYWKKQLEGAPAALELPTDHPRPPIQTYRGARQTMGIPAGLSEQLRDLSRQEGATLFMVLLAAFQVLLSRYTGQKDIVVGSDIANRNFSETESLLGFFINQIVLRADLSDDPTFLELLGRVRGTSLEAYAHQDLPFEKLVEAIQPERHLARSPLFQAKFLLQNTPHDAELRLPGLTLSAFNFEIQAATFDLLLSMLDMEHGLKGVFEYSTDIFEHDTITRLGVHFHTLLESIAADPTRRVSDLPILNEAERRRMLVEWNETGADYPRDKSIHRLFEEQVERTPDAVAVVLGDERLTYAELNRRANQLAHHLRGLGVGRETLVGLCVERSLEMIVGLLGVLKAGGAYLPLDPGYPLERLSFMLEDAAVPVLLTQEPLLEVLPVHWSHVVSLDGDWELIAAESGENPEAEAAPDNLAYVIYTSGSTGRPKGVMIEHGGLCSMVTAQMKAFDLRPDSRVLQFASFSFDASVSEVFMALLAGATLYLGSRESLMPGPELIRLLRDNEITTVTLPPSVLAVIESEQLPALKVVIAAGESSAPETIDRWTQEGGGRRLFNAYGPTEATVCATIAELDGSRVTIGRPIANTEVYILDARLQPVPTGVYGELHIGGVGLARGYLNRPDLTADKFIPHPFGSNAPGGRLYKTGDLARWLPDGNVEFAGRIDNQLKVRGYRIEAGEIETVLNNHPEVRTSVVVAREDVAGETRLAAYCVPEKLERGGASAAAEGSQDGRIELWPSVAEFYIYDDLLYHAMTADERRNHSYRVAINKHVRGKVVLDIGTGKDAILSRFCVAAGAERVYAIELLEESYEKAKATIESLGLADKIILIRGNSMEVELPEKVDVCVSEIVGPIGGSEGAAQIINNAWRFMKEGGVMIPERSVTKIAAVTLPEDFLTNPGFTDVSAQYAERVFEQIGHKFDLRLCMKNFSKANIISNAQPFEELDFSRPIEPEFEHKIELSINRDDNLVGFVVWLNLHTSGDEVIDILEHEYCWLPVYLPAFYPGVEAREGDRIEGTVSGRLSDNGLNLDYTVKGRLIRQGGEDFDFEFTTYHHKEVFRATEFHKKIFPDGRINTLANVQPQTLSRKLKTYLKGVLPDYMIPSHFTIIESLPLTPNGKVDRRALPKPGEADAGTEHGYVAPGNALESQLAWMWEDLLGVRPVGIRESFFELGGHSLLAVRLMARIKAQFGLDLPIAALFRGETVEELAKVLGEQGTAWRWSPLVPIQPRGTRPPFFCVHALGGNVNNYYQLARRLGGDQPFYGLQAPPLHEATEEDARIELMAARYVEAIREAQPQGPYRLGGYSFGSFVAYEMARLLRAQGQEVALLALFDTYSPVYLNKLPQTRDVAEMLVSLAWSASREVGKRVLLPVDELRRLSFDEQLDFFLEKMREEDLAPPEVDHELLSRFLKGSAARQRAARDYSPQGYDGRVTVFKCEERDPLWVQRLEATGLDPDDHTLGWGELSAEPVAVYEVPGHHDVICQEPFVESLARHLSACLETTSAVGRGAGAGASGAPALTQQ